MLRHSYDNCELNHTIAQAEYYRLAIDLMIILG